MLTENETLDELITVIFSRLEDLYNETSDQNDFTLGQKYAYVECLEIIQQWKDADKAGLAFEIEAKYPLH